MLDLTIMHGGKKSSCFSESFRPYKFILMNSACGWDGVCVLGPVRKTSPRGQFRLIKSVYSVLLQEIGWVCRLAEGEETQLCCEVSQLRGPCLLAVCTELWLWGSAAGMCPLSWHRRGDSP